MDKYISSSLWRVVAGAVLCTGLAYWLIVKDPYAEPVVRHCEWPPQPFKVAVPWPGGTVPWPEDARMSLTQGVWFAIEDLKDFVPERKPDDSDESWRQTQERWKERKELVERIEMLYIDEPTSDKTDAAEARRIAKDPDVVAVIGHEQSSIAVASAVTYEKNAVLYLSPKATLARLTRHRFRYTFRLVPNDDVFAQSLVAFAREKSWNKVGVLYGRFEQGEALAQEFALHARDEVCEDLVGAKKLACQQKLVSECKDLTGDDMLACTKRIELVYFRSYLPEREHTEHDFRELLSSMSQEDVDALLLADQFPWAAKVLRDMQDMGMKQPVLAGELLDSSQAWRRAGTAANNLYVASVVDPQSTRVGVSEIRDRFRTKLGKLPGYGSAQGYGAFNLLLDAIQESKCTDPVVLATTLRVGNWEGLFGSFSFDNDGGVVGRDIFIKHVVDIRVMEEGKVDGRFQTVSPPKKTESAQ
jgi:branched-chain amino acid transport system substrate-binding protein